MASKTWHHPSASSRPRSLRDEREPLPLPSARPIRNTARMMENTYTVAPISMPMSRVQTTSAPSALAPESPMVT